MRKNYLFITLLVIATGWSTQILSNTNDAANSDEIFVITGATSQILSLQQIRQIYLGMNVSTGASHDISIATLPNTSTVRRLFNVKVIGLSESRIGAFWAQMRFSGRGKQPTELADLRQMIEYVKKHQGSIGYVPANAKLPPEVKVIYSSRAP